jgi:FtsZ-binding cell division protein ZapB
MESTPFTTIESAEEFLQLLHVEIGKVRVEIDNLLAEESSVPRREEALRLVAHKLNQLQSHTQTSVRLLHDLRTLRTLLLK